MSASAAGSMLRIATIFTAFALILVGCGTSPQPKSNAPPPHALGPARLLVSAPDLAAFAQDGDQIAWWSSGNCPALHIRVLATRSETRIPPGHQCANAEYDAGDPRVSTLAFAGGRALWSVHTQGNSSYDQLRTTSLSEPKVRSLEELTHDDSGGVFLRGMTGDGATLVYTSYSLSQDESGFSSSGASTRLVGATTGDIPNSAGAFAVAVSGRLAALLRPAGLDDSNRPSFDDSAPIEVRDVRTGELRQRFKNGGRATAVALSPDLIALFVPDGSSTRVETYSVQDGHSQAKASLPSDATDLSLAGETVAFRSGRKIYALNGMSGRSSIVAIAKGEPIGLSIEGIRIAWGEYSRSGSRIVAVYLSAQ